MKIYACGFFLALSLAILTLSGCASFPEPADGKVLVVGQVESLATGYQNYGQATVNGRVLRGIELTFYDRTRGKDIVVKTNGMGMFHTLEMLPGSYRFTKLYLKVESSNGAWASLHVSPGADISFTVQEGVINNLGKIICTSNGTNNTSRFQGNNEYSTVEAYFKPRLEKTAWATWQWQELYINNIDN